jgi:hypothetical protein
MTNTWIVIEVVLKVVKVCYLGPKTQVLVGVLFDF